ncbi:MAG TPA: hypothetical protein VF807_15595, partial [Ktedonobacterales bacterium]
MTQPRLDIPNVRFLQALSRLRSADGSSGGRIYSIATYADSSGQTRVLLNLDGDLHAANLDGSSHQALSMGGECSRATAIAPNGSRVACDAYLHGGDTEALLMASADGNGHFSRGHITSLPLGDNIHALSWSPDGRYLAVVQTVADCVIAIYDASAQPDPTLALYVTSERFTDKFGSCAIGQISWSPDGQDVRFLMGSGPEVVMRTVGVSDHLPRPGTQVASISLAVADDQMPSTSLFNGYAPVAWHPSSPRWLAYALFDYRGTTDPQPITAQVMRIMDLHSLRSTVLFQVPIQGDTISYLAWLQDGAGLVFV